MAFCFSGSLLRANFNIVFLVLYCYCPWQINFFFFFFVYTWGDSDVNLYIIVTAAMLEVYCDAAVC